MSLLATALPENSGDGYVAAAYIVFFALVLIYVAIMAIRLGRVERAVRELREQSARLEETDGEARPESAGWERTLTGTPHGGGQAGEPV